MDIGTLEDATHTGYRLQGHGICGRDRKSKFVHKQLFDVPLGTPLSDADAIEQARTIFASLKVKSGKLELIAEPVKIKDDSRTVLMLDAKERIITQFTA